MVKDDDLKGAIRGGASTAPEIADELELSPSAARRRLKKAADEARSEVVRTRDPQGNGYVYGIADDEGEAAAEGLPVFGDREYDWAQWVPNADTNEYVEIDGELSDFLAIIEAREETGQLPRGRLTGPPGTGKTTYARYIAARKQWPLFPIQFTASMRDAELYGSPHLIGGESVWVDGPAVKALLCSRERPVVVLLDEINRAPFYRKASLQSFLDHRAEAILQLRGGEVITGDAQNLVTIATMNEGVEYETYDIDPAERRRHGNTWEIPFLGLVDADREAAIVADRTPVARDLARVFVEAANDIRELALSDPTSPIEKGIATSLLLDWARTAASYRHSDRPEPIRRAARTAIVTPHYAEAAAAEVEAVLVDALGGR